MRRLLIIFECYANAHVGSLHTDDRAADQPPDDDDETD